MVGYYILTPISVQTYVFNNIKKVSTKMDKIELLANKKHGHDQNTEVERSSVFRRERNEVKKDNIIHQS